MASLNTLQLVVMVANFVFSFRNGFGNDVCKNERVDIICPIGEFVLIENAFLGRLDNSRCYNRTETESDCVVDVRTDLEIRFGLNYSISFSMAETFVYGLHRNCSPSLAPSLRISHRCIQAFEAKCRANPDDGRVFDLEERNRLEVRCNVTFLPNNSSVPVMHWSRNGSQILPNVTGNFMDHPTTKLKRGFFRITFHLNESDYGNVFSCSISFKSRNNEETSFTDYVYEWNFTATVWYGPKNIWIEPVKTIYGLGDRIRCFADGNPAPIIRWSSVDEDLELGHGSILTLDDTTLTGSTRSFKCSAISNISRLNISKIVNASIEDAKSSYKYYIIGSVSGFVVLFLVVTGIVIASIRCRETETDDDLYIVQVREDFERVCSVEEHRSPGDGRAVPEFAHPDEAQYLDINGVNEYCVPLPDKPLHRKLMFSESEYLAIDHRL